MAFYITGDKHGLYKNVQEFCDRFHPTKDDYMIVLGDHGTSYYGPMKDKHIREWLERLPISFIMIRGNHDYRPSRKLHDLIEIERPGLKGQFFVDRRAPSILYTKEYGWYHFAGRPVFIIGGAASTDKNFRLEMQEAGHKSWRWFPDEQLSRIERNNAKDCFCKAVPQYFKQGITVMSHTCPLKYRPVDMKTTINDNIDVTMETWMDELNEVKAAGVPAIEKWYCGHYHIDKPFAVMRFMYNDIIEFGGRK